jgi:tetratricopeptide (TPR) repeat protein
LDLDPRNELAWCEHGMTLLSLKRYKEAIHSFDGALGVDPRYEVAWYGKARCLYELGKSDKAQHYIEMALEIDPDYKDAKDLASKIKTRGTVASTKPGKH